MIFGYFYNDFWIKIIVYLIYRGEKCVLGNLNNWFKVME